MNIEHYSFGKIIINGKTYTSDVIIYPEKVDSSWWRKQGHSLYIDDLKDVIAKYKAIYKREKGTDFPQDPMSQLNRKSGLMVST